MTFEMEMNKNEIKQVHAATKTKKENKNNKELDKALNKLNKKKMRFVQRSRARLSPC